MKVQDYNGPGQWNAEAIRERYLEHARRLGQRRFLDLRLREHVEGERRWVYPLMEDVIAGIEGGDPACVELGVEFVESCHRQAFGRILHANTARALRRAQLAPTHVDRLRKAILSMLVAGHVPHEYHEYAKLLRRIGLGDSWPDIRHAVDESNHYVMRYVRYFERFGHPDQGV